MSGMYDHHDFNNYEPEARDRTLKYLYISAQTEKAWLVV